MSFEKSDLQKRVNSQKARNRKTLKDGEEPKVYSLVSEEDRSLATGDQFSTCTTCSETFEQVYSREYNRYSNFKRCDSCRAKDKRKVSQESQTSVATIEYSPYKWQKDFADKFEKTRFGVISGGARSGKDFMSIMLMIEFFAKLYNEFRIINKPSMVPSFRMWIIAPVEKIARQNWMQLTKFFPKEWVVALSNSTMILETIGGGIIEVRSAYDPETLVGVGVDFAVITEAARIPKLDEVWGNVEDRLNSQGAGLNGLGGKAIINSSPLGKNYFYRMWCWGQDNHPHASPVFFSVRIPTTANPYMAQKYGEIVVLKNGDKTTYGEDLKRRKGRKFLQDNEAMFLDSGGVVFQNFRENCVKDLLDIPYEERKDFVKKWKEAIPGFEYIIGYDPASGSSGDTPALVIREVNRNRIVRAIDMYGKTNDDQHEEVLSWSRRYNDASVHALVAGSMFLQGLLEAKGMTVVPILEQGLKKKSLVLNLQRVVQNEDIEVLDDGSAEIETLIFQMEDYTEDEKTGSFSNKTQPNDDFVSALYACFSDYSDSEVPKKHYTGMISKVRRERYSNRLDKLYRKN